MQGITNPKAGNWKTGLEIAYHQCETQESGVSFCFRTPVEDKYLGTSHVLEYCVLQGSQKYDVSFLDLKNFSCFSPLMPFCLDEKYAYSSYCWWKQHFKDYEDEVIPAKISVPITTRRSTSGCHKIWKADTKV